MGVDQERAVHPGGGYLRGGHPGGGHLGGGHLGGDTQVQVQVRAPGATGQPVGADHGGPVGAHCQRSVGPGQGRAVDVDIDKTVYC